VKLFSSASTGIHIQAVSAEHQKLDCKLSFGLLNGESVFVLFI